MKLKILILILFASTSLVVKAGTPDNSRGEGLVSSGVVLGQNYPNPAKNKTVINVEFTSSEAVLRIYNVLGKLIEVIVVLP